MKTTVKDVMTTRVIWVRPEASFKEMAARLRENRVSAFPVIDQDDKVIGVVSEADMLAKEALAGEPTVLDSILHHRDQEKARGTTAGDLMTSPLVTITPEDTISRAARLDVLAPGQAAPRGRRQEPPNAPLVWENGRRDSVAFMPLACRGGGGAGRDVDHGLSCPRSWTLAPGLAGQLAGQVPGSS
jgi:hypothetical protein